MHSQHLGLACGGDGQAECLSCLSCHVDVERKAGEIGHPSDQNCSRCHEGQHKKVAQSLAAPKTAAKKQAETIIFDHDKHLAMDKIGGQCITCHSGLVSEAGGNNFPEMSTCFQCHEHQEQWDQGSCAPCHNSDLKQFFPQTLLRHGPGWDRQHGIEAAITTVQCANCHSKESCDDCHDMSQGLQVEVRHAENVMGDFVHPADFISRHSMEAAAQPARCLSCHRTETCDSCHQEQGVSAGRMGTTNPHPEGWTGPDKNARNHHGRSARRDILSCASCHDQGASTNCIQCHQVGGPGGNPHPEGWKSSRTPSSQMCNYCHFGGP